MLDFSRRRFLLDGSMSAAAALLLPCRLHAGATSSDSAKAVVHRLDNWEFRRGTLDMTDVWAARHGSCWKPVQLPHCFNDQDACDPDQAYFRGEGWYRTHLKIENPFSGGRTLLHFDGAGQTTNVWIGSKLLGTHKGGYDGFVFDITEAVRDLPSNDRGEVPILVCCANSPDVDRVPSDLSDFCLYGGLYRHIRLLYVPAVSLDCVHLLPARNGDGAWDVSVKARLHNPDKRSPACTISIQIFSPAGEKIHSSTRTLPPWEHSAELAKIPLPNPQLWSPETPRLYRCRVSLSTPSGEIEHEERFGLRHHEFVEHGPFLLNGKRVLLRGTQRHADHAGVAAGMTDEMVTREMRLIREMGANFIRLGHYQQDRLVLDLCDELGIMVWEEAPWCRAGVGSPAFQQNAKDMLAHMIDQHYNHPSVILWGLGNEDDWPDEYPGVDEKAIRAFMTEMRDLAHELDHSRLTAFRRCEFARDIPDVYSPSIWAGWYRGNYREYEQSLVAEREKVKRFIHMEWGADSLRGRHSEDPEARLQKIQTNNGTDERGLDFLKTGGDARASKDGDWSETYACNLFDWYLKTQERLDWLTGSAQWIFKDFASPIRADNAIPRMNLKGVVERDLTPKESYYVFQSYWAEKPMVHIYGHTWSTRWGAPGQKRTVRVYSNCERVELFLNGASLGVKTRNSQDFPSAGLRWDAAFECGKNVLRAVARRAELEIVDEITVRYQSDPWAAPGKLHLKAAPRRGNIVRFDAELTDANGIPCLDAAHVIRFSLDGAGEMIDNLGTSRASRVLQLYNGRAEISVLCKGSCTLKAKVDGLPAAEVSIS